MSALFQNAPHASIYLSYQWSKQQAVKQLYRGLTSLGYLCWMDVFDLGGDDVLSDKAERALNKADLMIACVSATYSRAAQCRRDVDLADALKKPMVVLMLESTDWPPAGPMSEALNNQAYINCVDVALQQQWMGVQFDELVVRISSMWSAIKARRAPASVSRQNSDFDARRQWKKVRNVGKAAVAFNKVTSKTCSLM